MIPRLVQPARLAYPDLCAALERLGSSSYKFEPLRRIEGGILCSRRNGVHCPDRVGSHMSVRLQWAPSWLLAYNVPTAPGEVLYLHPPQNDGIHNIIFETTGMPPWTAKERALIMGCLTTVLGWHELPSIGTRSWKDNR